MRMELIVPEDQSAGTYANGFGTWFNQTDFTIDYFVHLPANEQIDEETGSTYLHAPVQVVARIKLPPTLIFRLMQQLESTYTEYERMFGAVTPLGDSPDLTPPS
jgi:hypothetical protein